MTSIRAVVALLVTLAFASVAEAELRWGSFQRGGCMKPGHRQYSAVLHGIPWGHSWEATCHATSATVQGHTFNHPSRCVNRTTAMWGEFDVPDDSCNPSKPMRWGAFKQDHCMGPNLRQYSAVLHDIPAGMSWEAACADPRGVTAPAGTPAALAEMIAAGTPPHRCRKATTAGVATGMWGEYDIPDQTCEALTNLEWGAWKDEGCVEVPLVRDGGNTCSGPRKLRQYSAVLWQIPPGYSWEAACADTPVTIERGTSPAFEFPRPDVCVRSTGDDIFKYGGMIASTAVGMAPGFAGAGLGLASSIVFDLLGQDEIGAFNMWGIVYVDDPSCTQSDLARQVAPRLVTR